MSVGAPAGLPPTEALLVSVTAPSGAGAPIVRECPSDLQFSSTAPGGHDQMTCTLDWPPGIPPTTQLGFGSIAQVLDRRTGQTLWYGHVIDPGMYRNQGSTSKQAISCSGFRTILDTTVNILAYVDRDLSGWVNMNTFKAGSAQEVDGTSLGDHSGDWVSGSTSILQLSVPQGSTVTGSSAVTMSYLTPRYATNPTVPTRLQDIVLFLWTLQSASSSTLYNVLVRVKNSLTLVQTIETISYGALSTSFDDLRYQGAGAWTTTNAKSIDIILANNTGGSPAGADYVLNVGNVAVVFSRYTRDGLEDLNYTTYITVGMIVDDVIGRMLLGQLDISAAIDHPSTLVEQATWWGGVSAADVFTFLEGLYSDSYWAVWEPTTAGSLPLFEYVPWGTTTNPIFPRYIIPPGAGTMQLDGGSDSLYNQATVLYATSKGINGSAFITLDVPELDSAGITRATTIDLTGQGVLSLTGAQDQGTTLLAQQNHLQESGTFTLTGRIMDVKAGRMIEPWELRAGWSVVLGDAELRVSDGYPFSSNGVRDGKRTWRCTQVQYSASSNSAQLSLDGGGRALYSRTKRPVPNVRTGFWGHGGIVQPVNR